MARRSSSTSDDDCPVAVYGNCQEYACRCQSYQQPTSSSDNSDDCKSCHCMKSSHTLLGFYNPSTHDYTWLPNNRSNCNDSSSRNYSTPHSNKRPLMMSSAAADNFGSSNRKLTASESDMAAARTAELKTSFRPHLQQHNNSSNNNSLQH